MKLLAIAAILGVALAPAPALADPVAAAPDATTATAPAPDAAPPRLSNFADVMFSGVTGENAPEVGMDFAPGATLGAMPLLFEKTTLPAIQALYGGDIHQQGDAGDGVSWLCYTRHARTKADTPETAWFTSTSEMAGAGQTLSMVVVQNVDAARASGCATAPKSFSFPAFGIPSVGAALGDLRGKFGALKRDRQGNVYFDSTRPVGDGSGQSIYQSLGYVVARSGRVEGIALAQVTTD